MKTKDAPILSERDEDPIRVYCWRHDELTRAGYPLPLATAIAAHEEIDLHRACELLKRGCSASEAARILL